MEIKRACLVGVSGFGAAHYETLLREQTAGRLEIVGATVINPDEESAKCAVLRGLGCRMFSDACDMFAALRGQAELCLLPVGIAWHRPMVVAALQAGLHVIVEKPAAGAIQDVRAMQTAARTAGRVVAVAFQDLYSSELLQLKQALLDGRFGRVERVTVWGLWPRTHAYYARNDWAGAQRVQAGWVMDSAVNNACAHELMAAIFLAGATLTGGAAPERIEAETYRAQPIRNADTFCLRVATDNRVPIFGVFSHACSTNGGAGIRIDCSHGTVDWTRYEATLATADGKKEALAFPPAGELRIRIIAAVRQAAAGQPAFYCDLELASRQTLVMNGAHEASLLHDIPDRWLERLGHNGDERTAVKGLDVACERALREGKLFSELELPWAQPAGTCSLAGYEHFSGGKMNG